MVIHQADSIRGFLERHDAWSAVDDQEIGNQEGGDRTSGLRGAGLLPLGDVRPEPHSLEADLLDGFVGPAPSLGLIISQRAHRQNTAP